MEENIEKRVDLTLFSEKIQELKDQIASVIVGQEQIVDLVLTAILANGHVLIEGVPGVAEQWTMILFIFLISFCRLRRLFLLFH